MPTMFCFFSSCVWTRQFSQCWLRCVCVCVKPLSCLHMSSCKRSSPLLFMQTQTTFGGNICNHSQRRVVMFWLAEVLRWFAALNPPCSEKAHASEICVKEKTVCVCIHNCVCVCVCVCTCACMHACMSACVCKKVDKLTLCASHISGGCCQRQSCPCPPCPLAWGSPSCTSCSPGHTHIHTCIRLTVWLFLSHAKYLPETTHTHTHTNAHTHTHTHTHTHKKETTQN